MNVPESIIAVPLLAVGLACVAAVWPVSPQGSLQKNCAQAMLENVSAPNTERLASDANLKAQCDAPLANRTTKPCHLAGLFAFAASPLGGYAGNACLAILRQYEGCYLTAYRDPNGLLTIGYGHTDGVRAGQTITQDQADALLREDLQIVANQVSRLLKVMPTQGQFDAMCSFTFNVGITRLAGSIVLQKFNAGDAQGAAADFSNWDRAGGVILKDDEVTAVFERVQRTSALAKDNLLAHVSGFAPFWGAPETIEARRINDYKRVEATKAVSRREMLSMLVRDVDAYLDIFNPQIAIYPQINSARLCVLVHVSMVMGYNEVKDNRDLWDAISQNRWEDASDVLLMSDWPTRAVEAEDRRRVLELTRMMRTGTMPMALETQGNDLH
uniref:Lysozyme n=1 Tax=Mycena chlorophos TaxID=658473 RepID=A0ABQ0KZU8_MYCCL|nr:predicted protein [Mycena chlorophos]